MSMGDKLLIILFFMLTTSAFCQSRFSPQVQDRNFVFEENRTLLSVCVRDTFDFLKKYNDQIAIQQKHISLNCFVVRVLNRNALQALKIDANVFFVDHHKSPTT